MNMCNHHVYVYYMLETYLHGEVHVVKTGESPFFHSLKWLL